MTLRRTPLAIAMLGSTLVVIACGGTSPTLPAFAPTAPAETPIEIPTFDLGSLALPSLVLPSFATDKDLEALLPDSIGDNVVVKGSFTGKGIQNAPGGAAIEGELEDLGATVDDVSVAVGTAGAAPTAVVVFAYRIAGVSADRIFDGFLAALPSGGGETERTVAGRPVTEVVAAGETTYIYLADDVLFIIGGTLTPELLADAVAQLPAG